MLSNLHGTTRWREASRIVLSHTGVSGGYISPRCQVQVALLVWSCLKVVTRLNKRHSTVGQLPKDTA